jgi:hypothetical protein
VEAHVNDPSEVNLEVEVKAFQSSTRVMRSPPTGAGQSLTQNIEDIIATSSLPDIPQAIEFEVVTGRFAFYMSIHSFL